MVLIRKSIDRESHKKYAVPENGQEVNRFLAARASISSVEFRACSIVEGDKTQRAEVPVFAYNFSESDTKILFEVNRRIRGKREFEQKYNPNAKVRFDSPFDKDMW